MTLADRDARKKAPAARALKRPSVAPLRPGAGKGRKGLWVWDKAGVDLPFWQARKASGIYFLAQRKAGMILALTKERSLDFNQPISQGVQTDRVVPDRRGIVVREITFENPWDGQGDVCLTSEMTLAPGWLAKTRWEIEPVFDETKTKLQEPKSGATSATAKAMQTHFVAILHNLRLLVQDLHRQQGVANTAETERKQKRLAAQEKVPAKNQPPLPFLYQALQRFTQASFKRIRGWPSTGTGRPHCSKPGANFSNFTPNVDSRSMTPLFARDLNPSLFQGEPAPTMESPA